MAPELYAAVEAVKWMLSESQVGVECLVDASGTQFLGVLGELGAGPALGMPPPDDAQYLHGTCTLGLCIPERRVLGFNQPWVKHPQEKKKIPENGSLNNACVHRTDLLVGSISHLEMI